MWSLLLNLLLYPLFLHSLYLDVDFINDFMKNKNAMVTANVCWDKEKISYFINNNKLRVSIIKHPQNDFKNQTNYNYMYIVIDFRNCHSSWVFLNKVCTENLFQSPVKFLLLVNKDVVGSAILKSETNIGVNSEVFLANFKNHGRVDINQLYRIRTFSDTIFENFGNWSDIDGLTEHYKHVTIFKRRSNFRKQFINIGLSLVNPNQTLHHLTDFRYPRMDPFAKHDYPLMHLVTEYLNASINIRVFDKFGYYNEKNKTWDGIVNDMVQRQTDIAAMYINQRRLTVVDYLRAVGIHIDTRFIVKKPSTSYMQNIYLLTFSSNVWYAILLLICICVPAFFYLLNFDGKIHAEANMQTKYTLSDICLISLEALCQQGTNTMTNSYSSRTITLIFFTTFMFLYVSYSAYIIVLLQSTNKISLVDLLQSRIEVGGLNINYMKHYFEGPKEGVLRELYLKKIYPNQYFPLEQGMQKVQDGNFAFYVPLASAYHYILEKYTNYDICGLQTLNAYITSDSHIASQKNSPFKKIISVSLSRIIEVGLNDRNSKRVFTVPKCFHSSGNFQSVRLYDCYFAFMLFIYGKILCIILFFVELLSFKYSQRKNTI